MSMFPFDNENDDEDDEFEFDGDIDQLVADYENRDKVSFSPTELLMIFRHYSTSLFANDNMQMSQMKGVLMEGISSYPYMGVFAIHMAELCIDEQKYRMARKYVTEALAYNPMDAILTTLNAIIYYLEQKPKKAFEVLDKVFAMLPGDADLAEEVIEILMHYEVSELALMVYNFAIENDLELEHLFDQFYDLETTQEGYNKLIPLVQEMVDLDPYNASAWHLLGNIFIEIKDYNKAEWALDFARTIDNSYLDAHISYLEAVYENEKYEQFVNIYTELEGEFGKNSLDEVKGLLAWSTYELGNKTLSRKIYREVLKQNPDDLECWFSLGLTYYYEKDFTQALPLLRTAYDKSQIEVDYSVVYASCLVGLQEYEQAEEVYKTKTNVFPNNEELWLDWNAMLYVQGKFDQGIEVLEKAIDNLQNSAALLYRFGTILYVNRQKETALLLIETALQINPDEHKQMFIFAPEIKKSATVLMLISKYTNPSL